jgi:hypothetical protein
MVLYTTLLQTWNLKVQKRIWEKSVKISRQEFLQNKKYYNNYFSLISQAGMGNFGLTNEGKTRPHQMVTPNSASLDQAAL